MNMWHLKLWVILIHSLRSALSKGHWHCISLFRNVKNHFLLILKLSPHLHIKKKLSSRSSQATFTLHALSPCSFMSFLNECRFVCVWVTVYCINISGILLLSSRVLQNKNLFHFKHPFHYLKEKEYSIHSSILALFHIYCMCGLCWIMYQGLLNILKHIEVILNTALESAHMLLVIAGKLRFGDKSDATMHQWNSIVNKNDTREELIYIQMDMTGLLHIKKKRCKATITWMVNEDQS